MKKIVYLLAAAALTFSACHKDSEGEDGVTPANEPKGKGDVKEALDNQKAKEQLQTYATDFLNSFKPEDQKGLIEALNTFANICDDANLPWDEDKDEEISKKNFAGLYAKNLAEALEKKAYSKATTVNEEFVWEFKEYTGVYELKDNEWVKTSESSDIVFKYTCNGKDCEFKAVQASGKIEETFNDGEETYKIDLPAGVTITLTQAGSELFKTVLDVNYKSQESTKTTVSVKFANLTITSDTKITNTEITDNQTVAIDGNTLIWATGSAKGTRFCDVDHFETVAQKDEEDVEMQDYVDNFTAEVNIMGNVQIKSEVEYAKLEGYDELKSKEEAQKICDIWNKYCVVKFFFSGSDVEQGRIKFLPELTEEWRGEEYWDANPVIYFNADNTSYAFEDYFNEDRFANTEDQCEALWDKYEAYWK